MRSKESRRQHCKAKFSVASSLRSTQGSTERQSCLVAGSLKSTKGSWRMDLSYTMSSGLEKAQSLHDLSQLPQTPEVP